MRDHLENFNYEVIEASNVTEGIELMHRARPDAILCDLKTPEVDGLQVIALAVKEFPETPIITISGTGVIYDAIQALRSGAWDYLLKPITDMSLLDYSLGRALERARLLKENSWYYKHLEAEIRSRTVDLEAQTKKLSALNKILEADIEERIRMEGALRESETRFRSVVEGLGEGVLISDFDDKIIYANGQLAKICRYNVFEMIGASAYILSPLVAHGVLRNHANGTQAAPEKYELEMSTKDGGTIWTEVTALPFRNSENEIIGILSVFRDITALKVAEIERHKLERQLLRAQKLEIIGTLAGGVAHDFNNILTPIIGFADMGKRRSILDRTLNHYFDQILVSASRAQSMVQQILNFGRAGREKREIVLLHPIIKETIKLFQASITENVEVKLAIRNVDKAVYCDITQIHQVVMNLLTNAYHALRENGGSLRVKLDYLDAANEITCYQGNLQAGKYVVLVVEDTGVGMDQSTLDHLFEPFFTTKKKAKVQGLGYQ